ncbi:MAG: FAD-binding protein [Coriobacteriaceae bacterium]|nr:FAD-binding protein [Coriobacteriaceae bacterium]
MEEDRQEKTIDRRFFLQGAGAAALVTAMTSTFGLAGCAPAKSGTSDGNGGSSASSPKSEPSWFTSPEPIIDSEISETIETDVVVVGAGMAGISAACSSAERGLSVSVIERGDTWSGRGFGMGVADSKIVRAAGLSIDRAKAQKYWIHCCGSRVNESLVSLFFNRSGEAMDWVIDKCEKGGVSVLLWDGYSRDPEFPDEPGYHVVFGGPEQSAGRDWSRDATKLIYEDSLAAGAQYYYENTVEQLRKEGERVVGAIAKTADGSYVLYKATKGVVLATGDISGDQEMLDYYAPEVAHCNSKLYTPIGFNSGDGHKMGLWAGGAMQEGHFPPMLHPQAGAYQQSAFLSVNQNGERFFNEATWVNGKSLSYLRQPGQCAYSIFDKNWTDDNLAGLPFGGGMFWDTFRVMGSGQWDATSGQAGVDGAVESGMGFKADSLEELAVACGIPEDTFLSTVKHYNELCAAGVDTDFGKDKVFLAPVVEPPFYAMKAMPAILTIVGGLKVDTNLNVTDADGKAVEGLFAVGNVSGDFYAVDYPINIPGNSQGRCITWGYLVGETLEKA